MEEEENSQNRSHANPAPNNKIGQSQFYNLITSEEVSWQAIIYDLVKTEQLDPWNIDIAVLADNYFKVIRDMEEADFFVSSKVLLACSLLLRLKSEILANDFIQSLDDELYGKKEERRPERIRIEIDENDLPILTPRTPMARMRKVTLAELMNALNKAIDTETKRIRREIKTKQAEKSALVVMPNLNRVPLKVRISNIYARIKTYFKTPEIRTMAYSELAPTTEEKRAAFLPVLHMSNEEKLFLDQKVHFQEISLAIERQEPLVDEYAEEERLEKERVGQEKAQQKI